MEKIMDAAHLHLAITHAPLFGTIFGLGVLVYALIRKSDDVRSAAYGAFALSGLLAVAVYLSGRGAEHVVEDLPGVSEALIGAHEHAATVALAFTLALGVAAVIAYFIERAKRGTAVAQLAVLAVALCSIGSMGYAANLGGQIRHSEIRGAAATAAAEQPGSAERGAAAENGAGEQGDGDRD
jgi:hypothetical protein